MALPNGYISPSEKPSHPVEWTIFDGGGLKQAGGTTDPTQLFEFDPTGFDSYGYQIDVIGMTSSDSAQVYFYAPNGASLHNVYVTLGITGNVGHAASTSVQQVISPRIRVSVTMSNWSGTPSDVEILVQVFARRIR